MKSIMQLRDGRCYICSKKNNDDRIQQTQEHHVFGGNPNRKLSEKYGLKVHLCLDCHVTGKKAVHASAEMMQWLHEEGQRAFNQRYPELNFRKIFGKNYLDRPVKGGSEPVRIDRGMIMLEEGDTDGNRSGL